jgi:hypothetical protein
MAVNSMLLPAAKSSEQQSPRVSKLWEFFCTDFQFLMIREPHCCDIFQMP